MSLSELVDQYLQWDPNEETKNQIIELQKKEENNEILENLLKVRLTFGTAGLRAKMGPGYNAMNDLVILQTIQGIIRYLDQVFGIEAKSMVYISSFPSTSSSCFYFLFYFVV